MADRLLLGAWRLEYVYIRLSHGESFDLQAAGSLDQRGEVLLADGDLAAVHVDQELLQVDGGHPVQVDDVMLLLVLVLGQQRPEVRAEMQIIKIPR